MESRDKMFERFAASARTVVEDAKYEASRRGDRRIGTEHLLLALLHDRDLAGVLGVDAGTARSVADDLDRDALSAIGLHLGAYRPAGRASLGRPVPLSAGAKTVIRGALGNATAERARAITPRHLMLALLDRPEPDPTVSLFAALSVDRQRVRDSLAAA
jgi:ATP-dependent Clp protease ATP-binding subunit ClpA